MLKNKGKIMTRQAILIGAVNVKPILPGVNQDLEQILEQRYSEYKRIEKESENNLLITYISIFISLFISLKKKRLLKIMH